jgi:hypothetical protein
MKGITMTPTNQECADRCEKVIAAYSDDDTRTNLIDFLADAMHWCHLKGDDFRDALETAERHFDAETTPDDIAEDVARNDSAERNKS